MPTVYMQGRLTRPDDLPDVCAKCGAETTNRVTKTFNWVPPWIGITILLSPLIYIVLAMVLRKTSTVAVPLCKEHKGHWTNRLLLNLGSLFVLVGGSIALAVVVTNLAGPGPGQDAVGFAWLGVVGALLAWLVILVVTSSTAIRPKEITDRGIRLTGVGQPFVDAYEEQEDAERQARRGALDRFDERRPRRRDEDEDDRPRRPTDKRIQAEDEDDRPRKPRRERDEEY